MSLDTISIDISNSLSLISYTALVVHLLKSLNTEQAKPSLVFWCLAITAAFSHFMGAILLISAADYWNFNLRFSLSLIIAVTALIVLITNIKQPLHNLFLLLSPLAIITILISFMAISDSKATVNDPISGALGIHILLSITAFSCYLVASLQALLLAAYQRRMKQHDLSGTNNLLNGLFRCLPALDSMQLLLLNLIKASFLLLTVAIATGFFFVEDLLAQQLSHKTFFSLLTWLLCLLIIIRQHRSGWNAQTLVRWVLTGLLFLCFAYIGTNLVLATLA